MEEESLASVLRGLGAADAAEPGGPGEGGGEGGGSPHPPRQLLHPVRVHVGEQELHLTPGEQDYGCLTLPRHS